MIPVFECSEFGSLLYYLKLKKNEHSNLEYVVNYSGDLNNEHLNNGNI